MPDPTREHLEVLADALATPGEGAKGTKPHWTDACEPEPEDGPDPDRQRDEAYARRNGHT